MLAALLLAARPSPASGPEARPTDGRKAAAALLHSGMTHRRAGDLPRAMADFREAFELSGEPNYLYLLAETQREAGLVREALASYRRYLAIHPQAPDRQLVEEPIEALTQQPQVPPPQLAAPLDRAPEPAEGGLAPPRDELPPAPVLVRAAPPARTPLHLRPWLWFTVGAVAAGGLALGLGLGLRPAAPSFLLAPGAQP